MLALSLFVFASFAFGFAAVAAVKGTQLQLVQRALLSWLCGVQATGLILRCAALLCGFSARAAVATAVAELAAAAALLARRRRQWAALMTLERSPHFYGALAAAAALLAAFLRRVYFPPPARASAEAVRALQAEAALVASLRGANSAPRRALRDPNCAFSAYRAPALPLLYVAGCVALGASYRAVSFAVCLLNGVAAVALVTLYAVPFLGAAQRALLALAFVFGAGPRAALPPALQLLAFAKDASCSVPLGIAALVFAQNRRAAPEDVRLAVLLALATPSFATSLAVLLVATCYKRCYRAFLALAPVLALRYAFGGAFRVRSLWAELQMEGVFCAKYVAWIGSFGAPMLVLVFNAALCRLKKLLRMFVPNIAAFAFLCLIRYGNGIHENSTAICTVFLPQLLIVFIISIGRMYSAKSENRQFVGCAKFLAVLMYTTYVIGGAAVFRDAVGRTQSTVTEYDVDIANVVDQYVSDDSPVLAKPQRLSPVSLLSGRQVLLDSFTDAWRRDSDPRIAIGIIRAIRETGDCAAQMRKYGITYYLEEVDDALCNATSFRLLYSNPHWKFYKI